MIYNMSHRSIGIDLLGNKDWEEIVHCECSTVGEYLQTIYQLALKAKTEDITETIIEKKFFTFGLLIEPEEQKKSYRFRIFRKNFWYYNPLNPLLDSPFGARHRALLNCQNWVFWNH